MVLNSLILSKLWHILLRLVTFIQSEFLSLQLIIASFINSNSKISRFSFDTFTLPRSQGGLNLINSALQAHALLLQWRWIHPLLHPSSQSSPPLLPSVPALRSTLSFCLGSSPRFPSYHWSLFFFQTRSANLPDSGPVFNFIRAVDSIQRNFSSCSVDILTTTLRLPFLFSLLHQHALPPSHRLTATFSPPTTILRSSRTIRRNLFDSDILEYSCSFTHGLNFRQFFHHLPPPHPCASRRAVYMIHDRRLLLNTFFTLHNMTILTSRPLLSTEQLTPTSTLNIKLLHSSLLTVHP